MKNLIAASVVLSLATFAACGGSGADAAIAKMDKVAAELCACKDVKCAESAMKKRFSLKELSGKPSRAQMEKAAKIAERMADCQTRLTTAALPPPPC